MQERPDSYDRHPWYKVYSRESLEGSLRFELNSEERGVWWDFCHMANESRNRGIIQANDETPYPHPWLAAKLNISLELLERCIKKFAAQKRISENKRGIFVANFEYWQGLDTRRGRGRPPKPTRDARTGFDEMKGRKQNAFSRVALGLKRKGEEAPGGAAAAKIWEDIDRLAEEGKTEGEITEIILQNLARRRKAE